MIIYRNKVSFEILESSKCDIKCLNKQKSTNNGWVLVLCENYAVIKSWYYLVLVLLCNISNKVVMQLNSGAFGVRLVFVMHE